MLHRLNIHFTCSILAILTILSGSLSHAESPNPIHLPLCFHPLKSAEHAALNSEITADSIEKWVVEINKIWAPAQIQWQVDCIQPIDIQNPVAEIYQELVEQSRNQGVRAHNRRFQGVSRRVYPPPDLENNGQWHIYIAQDVGLFYAGIYHVKNQSIFLGIQGPAGSHPAEIIAHELGHSLGLTHRPPKEKTNLMTTLNREAGYALARELDPQQIDRARKQAILGHPYTKDEQEADWFRAQDINQDGCVNLEESKAILKRNFQAFDTDQSGCISWAEFLHRRMALRNAAQRPKP